MKMENKNLKSTQEQAIASWIQYLNKLRFENLINAFQQQDLNLNNALNNLDLSLEEIQKLINSNRGGTTGMHGFIAEIAEVGIGNAKSNILGNHNIYTWIDDNGIADLIRNETEIQQKFYQSNLSLGAISEHLKKYPNFLKNGGKYQIPRDQYEKICYLRNITEEQANRMPTDNGTFSLKQWKRVHDFFQNSEINFEDVEPANLEYSKVQRNVINDTIKEEKENIKETDHKIRKHIENDNKPNLKEATKITLVSATIEGGTEFVSSIIKKKREKGCLKNFNTEDWNEILKKSGIGIVKGGVRGSSLYVLTNYANTPSAIGNALVTSLFGMAEQVHLYRNGTINELEFIENSELLCLDSSVSALSSMLGQTIIPIPIIGAIIGNTVGLKMYSIAKENFLEKEQKILENYFNEIKQLDEKLKIEYKEYIEKINIEVQCFMQILEKLYSPNIKELLNGTIEIAQYMGVTNEEILDTPEKTDKYFLN